MKFYKNFYFIKSQKAFTLIEILVVLLIIVSIFAITSRSLYSKEKKIKTELNELVRLNRRIQNSSNIHFKNYRLVLRLNEDFPDEYWVEKQSPPDDDKKDADQNNQEGFIIDENFYTKAQEIYSLLDILAVEYDGKADTSSDGSLFYVYYRPNSLLKQMAIQIARVNHSGRWTLYLNPVTRELQVLEREKTLEEIKELVE